MFTTGVARAGAVLLAGVLGLVIGSFLNVVVWRVPRGESVVRPPSHCPHCAVRLGPFENVPVLSFLWLHGRCRHCREPISARYPFVELLTAALFAAMAWRLGVNAVLPAYLYLAAIAVALALIDLDTRKLPNVVVLPSYGVAAVLLALAAFTGGGHTPALRAVEGMLVCYCGYFLAALAYPGGVGFGDVKLAGVLGLYLGYLGWGAVAVGMFSAVLLGALVGVAMLAARRATRRTAIPYGPFLLAGTIIGCLAGSPLAAAYLRVSGA